MAYEGRSGAVDLPGDRPPPRDGATILPEDSLIEALSPGVTGGIRGDRVLEASAALVERRTRESAEAVSTLLDVATAEVGWWLLAELVALRPLTAGSVAESVGSVSTRSPGEVSWELNTSLLPKLLVTDLVEQRCEASGAVGRPDPVEITTEPDRDLAAAVLLLVAAIAEAEYESSSSPSELRTTAEGESA